MTDKYYKDYKDYLSSCGVNVVEVFDNNKVSNMEVNEQSVYRQLEIISELHSATLGFSGVMAGRLENCTGKKVEQFKVYLKKVKRDVKRIDINGYDNNFEKTFIKNAETYIERADKCISEIYNNGYYELIDRSMKRTEVCLGNTYFDNLRKCENIEVISTKKSCYNMVECDGVIFLGKLKKKGIQLDYNKCIGEFCKYEGLGYNSEIFMAAMLSYPVEFMKCCNRYRYEKKEWDEEEYVIRLLKAMEKDGSSIL